MYEAWELEPWELGNLFRAMPRAAPLITDRQLSKLLRGAFPETGPPQSLLAEVDLDRLVGGLGDLLIDVINATEQCPAGLCSKAAALAFTCDKNACEAFGQKLAKALSFCKVKAKESTSGKKM